MTATPHCPVHCAVPMQRIGELQLPKAHRLAKDAPRDEFERFKCEVLGCKRVVALKRADA
jgi:hypothetical protein